ncbi:hypothetical protein SAMD00024442_11_41 [Candidatus Symbiothrix dinenymphae]|nr:hypothetical protein SAMD00024442_11_41 [Candidatus Symbiothrix dinenymphae]
MAKKKKQVQVQLLSPENYIRQKSRSLPVYKCWVNKDWEDTRLAHLLIARKHANDNVTFCIYLVDLGCLGMKNTTYGFNISLEELGEIVERMEGDVELDDTLSYSLAHNIIYSAIEFAEEYGFKPHKDFTQITQFFLEEDTDKIPLTAVECGHIEDGKPFYIDTGFESPAKVKQIITQLNKTAGEGNYHFVIDNGEYDDDDEYDDDEYDDDEYDDDDEFDEADSAAADALLDELRQLSKEEQKALFVELCQRDDDAVTMGGVKKLITLTSLLAEDYTDAEAVEKYREELSQESDYPITEPLDSVLDTPADTLAWTAAFEKYLFPSENEEEGYANQLIPMLLITKMTALSRILREE